MYISPALKVFDMISITFTGTFVYASNVQCEYPTNGFVYIFVSILSHCSELLTLCSLIFDVHTCIEQFV